MSKNPAIAVLSGAWSVISWPVRKLGRAIAALFRIHGPAWGVMTLIAGFCVFLLLWNIVVAPQLMKAMLAGMPRPVAPVTVIEARSARWLPALDAVGTAKAFQGADVAAEADGVVAAIDVTPGDHVAAGQRLIQIDDSVEQADLIAAEANIKLQDSALGRTSQLTRKGVNSQAALDDARNLLDVAKSGLAKIRAQLDQKSVKARFDGTAGIPRVDVGQYVTKGTVLITLQDIDRIYVDFTVPEQAASSLGVGQTAHFGAVKDKLDYEGRIIGFDPKVDPKTRLISVRAEIAEAKGRVLPGQFLQARIDLPPEPNIIALPSTAVIPNLYGDYVFVIEPNATGKKTGTAHQVIVKTGRRGNDLVEVIDGLKPGQLILANGQNAVQDGAQVEITATLPAGKLAENDGGRR